MSGLSAAVKLRPVLYRLPTEPPGVSEEKPYGRDCRAAVGVDGVGTAAAEGGGTVEPENGAEDMGVDAIDEMA